MDNYHKKINYFYNEINICMPYEWCFTGSVAIYLYALKFNIACDININDFDVVYMPISTMHPKFKKLGKYYNKNNCQSNNGIIFIDENKNKIFDLICSNNMSYCNINISGIIYNLINPNKLLDLYKDEFIFNNKPEMLLKKINILEQIINKNTGDIISIQINNKKEKNLDLSEGKFLNFDDD
jgi:hypothetical protein